MKVSNILLRKDNTSLLQHNGSQWDLHFGQRDPHGSILGHDRCTGEQHGQRGPRIFELSAPKLVTFRRDCFLPEHSVVVRVEWILIFDRLSALNVYFLLERWDVFRPTSNVDLGDDVRLRNIEKIKRNVRVVSRCLQIVLLDTDADGKLDASRL